MSVLEFKEECDESNAQIEEENQKLELMQKQKFGKG